MRTVPAPTRMPSACVRRWWKSSRSVAALIGAVRPASVALPSAEETMLTAMYGRSAGARSPKPSPLAAWSTETVAGSGNRCRSSTAARVLLAAEQGGLEPAREVDARCADEDQEERVPDQLGDA